MNHNMKKRGLALLLACCCVFTAAPVAVKAESIDISNMDLLIDFAKIGVGVACVIKSFVTKELQEGSLVEIPLGIPIHKREIGFAYKENLKPSKSLQTFIDFYRTYRPEETL